MKKELLKFVGGLAMLGLSFTSTAALLDLTDSSVLSGSGTSYTGSVDGVGFTLTSTGGDVNFSQNYDGSWWTGCGTGGLKCEKDGVGIDDDEVATTSVSSVQKLALEFDSTVAISGLHFLDLYTSASGTEQAEINFYGVSGALIASHTVDATEISPAGGYAALFLKTPVLAKLVEFTATIGNAFKDDGTNDYALAGVNVSAVPVPAAAFLFAPALLGFMGLRRKAKK